MRMRKRFSKLSNINKTNLNKIQQGPGVYGIYSGSSRLLKVGRAKRGRPADRILENKREIPSANKFAFIPTKTVQDAIKLETKLIKSRKPPENIEKRGK